MINENQNLITNQGAQGDILITRRDDLTSKIDDKEKWEAVQPENNKYIVAHSETGHHHTLPADNVIFVRNKQSKGIFAIRITNQTHLTHEKHASDKHKTHVLQPGTYEVRRQYEYDMVAGYRLAMD